MKSWPDITGSSMLRIGALATIAGTLIYVAMSILHGNTPIGDASKILDHVAERPWWRAAHLANIFAILLWLAALSTLTGSLGAGTRGHSAGSPRR